MNHRKIQDKLNAHLARNHLKSTAQRDAIIEAFLKMEGRHVTIEDVLVASRKKHAGIGYATVYRTLILLVEAGVANQRKFGDGQSRFEIASGEHHDHLICTRCGHIIEFKNEAVEKIQEKIASQFNFELSGHKMELYGVCEGMKNRGVCNYQSK